MQFPPVKHHQANDHEPIFGEGARPFALEMLGLFFTLILILAVSTLGARSRATIGEILFGKEERSQHQPLPAGAYTWTPEHGIQPKHLEPGQSTVVDGWTIKRID